MININFKPDILFSIGGFHVTNTILTTFIVTLIIVSIVIIFNPHRGKNFISKALEVFVFKLLHLADSVTGDRRLSKRVLPVIATFFIFIISSNLIALIPGFLGSFYAIIGGNKVPLLRSPNSDLNTTIALSLLAVFTIQYISITEIGVLKYIKRFINFGSPLKFVTGFFEMISEGTKLISFAFRLFGNIFAGEVLLLIIAFIIPYIIPLPFMILEVLVGVIQSFIFAMLALTFARIAVVKE